MSKRNMGSIFHIKNQWNILVIGKYYVNYQNNQNLMLLTSWILNGHWWVYSCLQTPPERTGFNMELQLTFLALQLWWHPCWIPGIQYTVYSIVHMLLFWLLYTASCMNTVLDKFIFKTIHSYLFMLISNPLNLHIFPRV